MSVTQNYSMPYPVLGLGDDYKESNFTVEPEIYVKDDFLHIGQGDVYINNETVLKLFQEKKITTAYKILCSSTLFSKMIIGEAVEKIDVSKLSNQIEIEVFLIAAEDLTGFTDDDFNDDYFDYGDGEFDIEQYNIVGVAGSQKIPLDESYYQGAKSLFRFSATSDFELQFSMNDLFIEVIYPWVAPETNYIAALPSSNKHTFIFIFVIPALANAFSEINRYYDRGEDQLESFLNQCKPADILYNMHKACIGEDPYVSAQKFLKSVLGAGFLGDSLLKEVSNELIK